MAGSDVGALVLQLSAKIGDFERQLAKANGTATKNFNAINRKAREADKKLNAHFNNMARRASAAFGAIGAALGVRELAGLADQWSDLNARLTIATGSTHAGADAMERLSTVARRSYSSLENTVESFIANSTALKELGYNTQQQLDYTEALNNALVISGAKGERAKAVMNALSKAMAGGKLSGQNLNTVIEQGGRVAEALADSMGVSVSKLRELGAAGKITSKEMFGITSQINKLNKELDSMPTTIQDGFTLIRNALLEYVGTADQASAISGTLAKGLTLIADNFSLVGDAALVLAGLIATRLIGRSLVPLIARAKDAGVAVSGLLTALRSAQSLSGVMAAFGGVAGLAIGAASVIGGALVLAMSHYSRKSAEAEAASNKIRSEWEKMGLLAPKVEEAVDGLANSLDKLGKAETVRRIKDINDELERITAQGSLFGRGKGDIQKLIDDAWDAGTGTRGDDKAIDQIVEMLELLQKMPSEASHVRAQMEKIQLNPNVSRQLAEFIDDIIRTTQVIEAAEIELRSLGQASPMFKAASEQLNELRDNLVVFDREVQEQADNIFDAFRKGQIGVDEFKSALDALYRTNGVVLSPENQDLLGKIPAAFWRATESIKDYIGEVQRLNAIRMAENELPHSLEQVAEQQQHINQFQNDYVKELDVINAKTREQLELERKIADIKKGYEAKNGEGTAVNIPELMWEEQANKALDADKRRSQEGKSARGGRERDNEFERLTKQLNERTAAMREEAGIVAQLNPLINDYGYALNKATYERQMWAAARKAGLDEKDGVAEAITQIAEAATVADVELQKVYEASDKLKSKLEEVRNVAQDTMRTFINDMIEGKSVTEALGNALSKIGNKLIDSGLNALFDGLFKGFSGGGGAGGIFSMLFRADGGEVRNKPNGKITGRGTSRSDSIPTMLSNGEFVVNAAATKKYRALLEQINAGGVLHRADGGIVGGMPSLPSPRYLQGLKDNRERALRVDVRPSPLFDVKVTEISDSRIEKAAPNLVNQAVTKSDSRFSQNYQDAHNRSYL